MKLKVARSVAAVGVAFVVVLAGSAAAGAATAPSASGTLQLDKPFVKAKERVELIANVSDSSQHGIDGDRVCVFGQANDGSKPTGPIRKVGCTPVRPSGPREDQSGFAVIVDHAPSGRYYSYNYTGCLYQRGANTCISLKSTAQLRVG